jgi:hypothetical protein
MQDDEEARAERRRIMGEAVQPYFVPGYEGHWSGVLLFAATLVGATMLFSCFPMAMAVIGGGRTGAADGQTAATFLVLYAAMLVGPAAGWILWGSRRRWAAVAVVVLFAACVVWLKPAAGF